MERLGATRTRAGPKPKFIHDEHTGAYVVKEGSGGINWYRYQKHVLIPLLIPFAKECEESDKEILVQEDNAPAHSSRYQQEVYDLYEVIRLLWPANSPDLNPIEPCWYWMKRKTTAKGPIYSKKQLTEDWIKCWEELPQEKIQAWIERIPRHVQEIIRLEGGNAYAEGRLKGTEKKRVH